jgi:hypothetical protein
MRARDPRQQPFVDALERALASVGGEITIVHVEGQAYIGGIVNEELHWFTIGQLLGHTGVAVEHAKDLVGSAWVMDHKGKSVSYWDMLRPEGVYDA